jgi:hypothetical protein
MGTGQLLERDGDLAAIAGLIAAAATGDGRVALIERTTAREWMIRHGRRVTLARPPRPRRSPALEPCYRYDRRSRTRRRR